MLYILTCAIRFPLYMLFNQEIRNAFRDEFVRKSCFKFCKISLKKDDKYLQLFNCLYKCCFCCYNTKYYNINKEKVNIKTQNDKIQYQPKQHLGLLFLI